MATEEHRVVIGVDYLGSQDVDQFLRDLSKLGPTAQREMRRLAEALRNGQQALQLGRAPEIKPTLALPPGQGQPRVDGRFASRQRVTELAQDEYLRGLRARIQADRAATQSANEYARAVRFQDRVGQIAERPGAQLSFGPGGNPELAFTAATSDWTRKAQDLSTRLGRINGMLAGVEAQYANVTRNLRAQANARAAEINRDQLLANLANQQGGTGTTGGDVRVDMLMGTIRGLVASNGAGKSILHQGKAPTSFVNGLDPEMRQALLGSPERVTSRTYGPGGVPIPGLTNSDAQLRAIQNEASHALLQRKELVEQELRDLNSMRELQASTRAAREAALADARALAAEQGRAEFPGLGRGGRQGTARGPAFEFYAVDGEAWASHPSEGTVGSMNWATRGGGSHEIGEIQMVSVVERWRRMGIATAMLEAALNKGFQVIHSPERTPEGSAWAHAVTGGNAPQQTNWIPSRAKWGIDEYHRTNQVFNQREWARQQLVPHPELFGQGQYAMPEYERAMAALQSRQTLVPHASLYGQGANALPEYERALAAIRAREQADAAAAGGNGRSGAGAGSGGSGSGGGGRTGGGAPHPDDEDSGARRAREAADRVAALEAEAAARSVPATDRLLRAKLNLANAMDKLDAVIERDTIAYGSKKGFPDRDAADQAIRGALVRQDAAAAQVRAAEQALKAEQQSPKIPFGATAAPTNTKTQYGPADPRLPLSQATIDQANQAVIRGGGLSTLQAAQQQAATAQSNLAAVTKQHAQVMGASYMTQQQGSVAYAQSLGNLTRAQAAAQAAQQNLTQLQRTQAAATSNGYGHPAGGGAGGAGGGGGGVGGFFSAFGAGFRGNPDVPVASQLGQTARFSVFYGTMYKALFAITQTFQQALQEGIQFEDAMTNLVIAADKPREELEGLAKTLGEQSVRAGFAPSQGIEIGARSLGLYGASQAPLDVQSQVATISSRVVSQLAVGSKKDPVQLQGDIAAIGQALGTGAVGQQRIADLDAYFTKRFGVQQGSTLETVAQSASVGKAAGFSDEQLFAIAADMISRTGQTPSAVAGFMAQIFSRGGEGSLVDVAAKQGIDPNQDLARIVQQLADIYKTADPRTQSQISAAFGRGKVQNAAVALLGDYSEVQAASATGVDKSVGAADKQFEQHMANIGGQLRELGGMMRLFAQELGQAGLLDVIGAGIIVLKDLVQAGNALLGIWNEMPRVLRDVIIGLVALKFAAGSSAAGALFNKAALAGGLVRAAGPVTAGGIAPLVTAEGAAVGGLATAGRVGLGFLKMVAPMGLAVGGLLAIGSLISSANRMRDAQEGAVAALGGDRLNPLTATSADYRAQASELKAQADANKNATGFFANFITGGRADDRNLAVASRLEAEARRLGRVADNLPEAATPPSGPFRSLAGSDITSGIQSLQSSGATAERQLAALRDVLYGTAGAAKAAADAFDPQAYAGQAAGGLFGGLLSGFDGKELYGSGLLGEKKAGKALGPSIGNVGALITANLTPGDIKKRLAGGLGQLGVDSLDDIDPATATDLARILAGGLSDDIIGSMGQGYASLKPQLQKNIIKFLRDGLLKDSAGVRNILSGDQMLSGMDATTAANSIVQLSDARLGLLDEGDNKGRVSEARQRLRDLRRLRTKTTDPNALSGINQAITQGRALLVDSQLAEIDAIRKAAYQNATTRQQLVDAGRTALTARINAIVKNGTGDQLAATIAQAGHGAIRMALQAIKDALKIARAAIAVSTEMAQLGADLAGEGEGPAKGGGASFRGVAGGKANSVAQGPISRLERMADVARAAVYAGGKNNIYTPEGIDVWNRLFNNDASKGGAGADKDTPAEIAAAKASALATQSGNPVAQAQAHIQTARAAMAKAKKNTVAWFNAQADLFTAQNEYNAALGAVGTSAAQLQASQSGSPVDAAKAQIVGARQAMVDAKGDQVAYNAALGQLFEGQRSLSQANIAVSVAAAGAQASRVGGGIAQAKSGIIAAKGAMKAAAGDQAAFYAGLGQLYESQRAMRDAVLAGQKNNMLLGVDMTNPLSVAQVDSRAAALKLASDRRAGQAPDVLAQDKVDLRTARNNEESTRFSQRLQSVQTAEQLGRISHAKYINYLDSEHRRLEAIKNRTFQQQQQLDQIDGLMKDAASAMEGQFNFGDIKLPTPYEVRRYVQQANGAGLKTSASAYTSYQTVTLNVNGADTAKVTRIVQDVVGKNARTTTTTPRRR